mmetsp:Transcript_2538/g.4707  ORF Transcript_2538/g.4707 Transcript_2538/m.4707 type:complete len:80 (-) Transcript_2538:736-975(-)
MVVYITSTMLQATLHGILLLQLFLFLFRVSVIQKIDALVFVLFKLIGDFWFINSQQEIGRYCARSYLHFYATYKYGKYI